MAVGPRLDRPSAIGDEGRPRATSLGIASVVLAATLLAVAHFGSLWRPLQTTLTGAGLVVGGTGLLRRDSFSAMAIGHLMFLPGGVITITGVATSVLSGGPLAGNLLFVFGTAVAAIGIGGAWANVDYETTVTAVKQGWIAVFVPLIGTVLLSLVGALGWLVFELAVAASVRGAATVTVSGFFFLLGLAILALWLAVDRLPITELAAREQRGAVEARRQHWQSLSIRAAVLAFALWVVVGLLEVFGVVAAAGSVYRLFVALFGSPVLRVPVFLVGALALLAVAIAWTVRRVTRGRTGSPGKLAPIVGGIALLGIPAPLLLVLMRGLSEGGTRGMRLSTAAMLAAILVSVVAVLFLLAYSLGPVAVALDLLPDRAGAISLASAGALLAATGAALMTVRPALAFATVAAAMVVWDSSEFGLGLTAELGHIPDTQRLELVHGVAGLGIGVAAVLVATGLDAAFRAISPGSPILSAMVLSVGGVLLLLTPLRG